MSKVERERVRMRRSSYYIEDCCVKGGGDVLIVLLLVMRIASALTRPINTTTVQVLKTMFTVKFMQVLGFLSIQLRWSAVVLHVTREKYTTLLILPIAEIWQVVIVIQNEVLELRALLLQVSLNLTLYIYLFRTKVRLI